MAVKRDDFGTTMRQIWHNIGITFGYLGLLGNNFETTLGPLWDNFKTILCQV